MVSSPYVPSTRRIPSAGSRLAVRPAAIRVRSPSRSRERCRAGRSGRRRAEVALRANWLARVRFIGGLGLGSGLSSHPNRHGPSERTEFGQKRFHRLVGGGTTGEPSEDLRGPAVPESSF